MRTSGWDVLERHFEGMSPDEVDAELAATVTPRGATPTGAPPAAYLAEHGGPGLDDITIGARGPCTDVGH